MSHLQEIINADIDIFMVNFTFNTHTYNCSLIIKWQIISLFHERKSMCHNNNNNSNNINDKNDLKIRCITPYHIISYIISYHIISYHIIYHIISDQVTSRHVTSRPVIYYITSHVSYRIISYVISYHIISYHIISYVISYHISYHIISYHIACHHRFAHKLLQLSSDHADSYVCNHVSFVPYILHTSVTMDM